MKSLFKLSYFIIVFVYSFICLPANCEENSAITEYPIKVEFRLVCQETSLNCDKMIVKNTKEELFLENQSRLTIEDILYAKVETEPLTTVAILLKFTEQGRDKLAQITANNVGRRLGVVIDGNLIFVPQIKEPILDGEVVIAGKFTEEDATSIVQRINKLVEINSEEE